MKSKVVKLNERNYGALTDVSKSLNYLLGDRSNRTVSMRTANGFKNTFRLSDMDDNEAEDIVHSGMIASGLLLLAKNDGLKVCGLLLSFVLLVCYQNGK